MITSIVRFTALVIAISVTLIASLGDALAAPAETVLYSFSGADGANPYAGLLMDKTGALYGTTTAGGAPNEGTVFMLTPPAPGGTDWSETVLHSFQGATTDGAEPNAGLIMDKTGALYGTTTWGGLNDFGTVFKLTPPARGQTDWTESVLYSFKASLIDGVNPYAGLVMDKTGALYGTTPAGGGALSAGTVFKLTPPARGQTVWSEAVIHSFYSNVAGEGLAPFVDLVMDSKGALYGMTSGGGADGLGTVFKLTPPARGQTTWSEAVIYSFGEAGSNDGAYPYTGLIMDSSGALYGTTPAGGGSLNEGTVFKLTPPGRGQAAWTETVLHSFDFEAGISNDGAAPYARLAMDSTGALYGTTAAGGGLSNLGTVFTLTPPPRGQTDWTEAVLYSFGATPDGEHPVMSTGLVRDSSGALYGTTLEGGTSGLGTVFKLTP